MARLNSVDPRNSTLHQGAVRVAAGQMIETDSSDQLGTWVYDVYIPAYALIQDIIVQNEVEWGATSATLVVGDYTVDSDDGSISTVIDADGFYTAVSLVNGGTIASGGTLDFAHTPDAVDGAYLTLTDVVEANGLMHTADRWIRASLTTATAAGTQAGKTFIYVVYMVPELDASTFTAA